MGRVSEQAIEDQQQPADAVDPATADPATAEVVAEDRIEEAEQSGRVATDTAEPGFVRFDCIDPGRLTQGAEAARHAVEAGECVVLPTDTVYGIGADAFDAKAVQRLLDAKGRGRDMPPPVLIADAGLVRALATDVPESADRLTAAFWPGALTIIVSARASSRMDLGETEGTIALRVPDHELARTLLRQTGPMAVSSANLSGRPAALDCDEAIGQLGDRVSVYLDGGRLGDAGRPPSTIVDFSQSEHGQLLRAGAISLDALREIVPELADIPDPESASNDPEGSDESASRGVADGEESAEATPAAPRSRASRFSLQPPKA